MKTSKLQSGDVGYVVANIRDMEHIEPGDTITTEKDEAEKPLPGYKKIKPMAWPIPC